LKEHQNLRERGTEMTVGFVYDPVYLMHDTGQHVENAGRLEAIMAHLEQTGLSRELVPIKPREASPAELALVHDENYVASIQEVARRGGGWLDPDTVTSAGSYEAAAYAAGGALAATEAVMADTVSSVFALVRPPGHHATPHRAMGFCLFNNLAIAVRYALDRYNLERVAIIDFDVHHGNGTQETFYDNPRVLYVSTHQSPFYPGTGYSEETGGGAARGTKVNIPLPAGSGDEEYLAVFEQVVVPVVKRFQPQLIMASAGYDNHWADPLAMMQVTVTGFARMTGIIKGLAKEFCHGRIIICLEGGYHLQALAASVKATLDVLLDKSAINDPLGPPTHRFQTPAIGSLLGRIKEIHALT
jgi:acetoin utilization deacetylase AcuC-like enzyme